MHPFSDEEILEVWEAGRERHELDRALTLLAAASPESSYDELAELSIGERDARLLDLRTSALGPHAEGSDECPECGARIELFLDTREFVTPRERVASSEMEANGSRVRFRMPNSRDLGEAAGAPDAAHALRLLVERCVIDFQNDAQTLDAESVQALGDAMLQADPHAEITLALACPDCGHRWETLFDIAAFFWDELAAQARRLLGEIDAIARAYGWSEREILRLSSRRRQTYLELLAT